MLHHSQHSFSHGKLFCHTLPNAATAGMTPASSKGTVAEVRIPCLRSLRTRGSLSAGEQDIQEAGGWYLVLRCCSEHFRDGRDMEMLGSATAHDCPLSSSFSATRLWHWSSPSHLCCLCFSSPWESHRGASPSIPLACSEVPGPFCFFTPSLNLIFDPWPSLFGHLSKDIDVIMLFLFPIFSF